jgi:NADPH:quinone reductase-like Zn-dependent oxidoreductase
MTCSMLLAISETNSISPTTVLGMDLAGIVVDKGTSSKYEVKDRIIGAGSVGWSDGGSCQSHVLIHDRDTCKAN